MGKMRRKAVEKIIENSVRGRLSAISTSLVIMEERMNEMTPIFFKVGDRIINFRQILTVDLRFISEDGECVAVKFEGDLVEYFFEDEAIMVRQFLCGGQTFDLENLYQTIYQ